MNKSRVVIAILLSGLSIHALAAVQASLSQNQVGQGDTVQLTLQQNGSSHGGPDLIPLKRDFDIVGTSQGSNIQIVNGSFSQQAQVQVILSPKHGGSITIPPLQWGKDHTQALTLNVSNTTATSSTGSAGQTNGNTMTASTANNTHVFIETTLNDKQPYVQGTAILTLKLYTDEQLYQASLDLAANSDILVQQLGKDEQHSETRNGHNYQVIQRQYLLTPQRSGQLHLEGPVLNAQIAVADDNDPFGDMPFGGIVTSARPIRLHGDPIVLNVHPRPVDSKGHDLLPATQLTLQESWKPDQTSISTGEPLTRHLHLSAQGLMGNALPDLSSLMQLPDGLKAYPDQAKTDTNVQNGNVVGSSDQDIALIANKPGHYELPAIKLAWWDTAQQVQREVSLPARILDVTGAAINTPLASPDQPTTQSSTLQNPTQQSAAPLWRWVSLALGGLWLITLSGWWRDHRRLNKGNFPKTIKSKVLTRTTNASQAMKAFQQACMNNQALDARHQLLLWASLIWKENPPTGLNVLAKKLSNSQITELLEELDRACYGGGSWNGKPLAQIVIRSSKELKTENTEPRLKDLYED